MIRAFAVRAGILAATLLTGALAIAQTTHFVVVDSVSGDTLDLTGGYVSGTQMSLRVEARRADGSIDTDNNRTVTVSLPGLPNETLVTATGTFVAGVADPVDVTPILAGTGNRRVAVTDGNIVDDDASGFFTVAPFEFRVTRSGSNRSLSVNSIIEGPALLVRVTALNFDGSVSTGYTGDVDLTSTALGGSFTASIGSRGFVDNVFLIGLTADVGVVIDASDTVTTTAPASDPFDVLVGPIAGGNLTVSETAIISSGPYYPGSNFTVRYQLNNDTDPAVDVVDPDVVFIVQDSDDRTVFSWTERLSTTVVADGNTGRRSSSYTLPFFLAPGAYTVLIRPGGNANEEDSVGITVSGLPDMAITNFRYDPGVYRAGDAMRFNLVWQNLTNQQTGNFPPTTRVAADNSGLYRVEIHLSRDANFGGEDDFLVWRGAYVGNGGTGILYPGESVEIYDSFILPKNYAGTFYMLAKVNSAGGPPDFNGAVVEGVGPADGNPIIDGNNETVGDDNAKITLLPEVGPTTERVSVSSAGGQGGGYSVNPATTRDGRFIVFESQAALGGTVQANTWNVYLRDQVSQTTTLVSVSNTGGAANGDSRNATVSDDGRYVVFESLATNLVAADTNAFSDVFLRDLVTGSTRRLSAPLSGGQANSGSFTPSISATGRWIAFRSNASNLVASPAVSGTDQIYLYDRDASGTGTFDTPANAAIRLVSQAGGLPANAPTANPRISRNGNVALDAAYVVFETRASTLLGGTSTTFNQIVRWERATGNLLTITQNAGVLGDNHSGFPAINTDGTVIAFSSRAQNLDPSLTQLDYTTPIPHVFRAVADSSAVTSIARINTTAGLEPISDGLAAVNNVDLGSLEPSISDDGTLITFSSEATNWVGPLNVRDVDGSFVSTELVQNHFDENFVSDAFLFDATTGEVDRVTVSRFGYEATAWTTGVTGTTQVMATRTPVISGDGRYVAYSHDGKGHHGLIFGITNFEGLATNSPFSDIYVHDRKTTQGFTIGDPSVAWRTPVAQTVTAGGSVLLSVDATSVAGTIASVRFVANGNVIGTVTAPALPATSRYTFEWTPANLAQTWEVTAVATDARGFDSVPSTPITVTVAAASGAAPAVTLVSPVATDSLTTASTTRLIATATDANGDVASMAFFVNGVQVGNVIADPAQDANTFPYSFFWTPPSAGIFTIVAAGTDLQGNRRLSGAVTVSVTNGTNAPTVSLSPSGSLTVNTGAVINLVATATDVAPGVVQSVQFFSNGVLISTDTVAPYTATFTPAALGQFEVTAVATDNNGNRSTSAVTTVTARAAIGAVPTVSIIQPAGIVPPGGGGGTPTNPTVNATTNSVLGFVAQATDDAGIASVQFFANGVPFGAALTSPEVTGGSTYRQNFNLSSLGFGSGAYNVTAVATDTNGNRTTSAALTVNVSATTNLPPSISISASPSSILIGGSSTITASVSDSDGTVASVQFLSNGTVVANDTEAPFIAAVSPTLAGSYNIVALATDNSGNVSVSNAVSLTVGGSAPTVSISAPSTGASATVGTPVFLEATVASSNQIATVAFFAGATNVGTAVRVGTSNLYRLAWSPAVAQIGTQSVTAFVTDAVGQTASSSAITVNVAAQVGSVPVVEIVQPTSGAVTTASTLNLAATAIDADGTIASVQFYLGGSLIGSGTRVTGTNLWTLSFGPLTNLPIGAHQIVAVATDSSGNRTASGAFTINVSVAASVAPTVSLSSSLTSIQIGQNALLTASAADADGTVSQVQFFINGSALRSDFAAPFGATFTPTAVGTYSAVAVATDSTGNSTVSNAVTITVTAGPLPSVQLLMPSTFSVNGGSSLVLLAKATSTSLAIDDVEFYADGVLISTSFSFFADGGIYDGFWFVPTTPLGNAPRVYSITAVAVDSAGQRSAPSAPVLLTVPAPTTSPVPSVVLVQPSFLSEIRVGSSVRVVANVSDSDRNFVGVEFYANGTSIGTVSRPFAPDLTSGDYSLNWTAPATGYYAIIARAFDSAGNSVFSGTSVVSAIPALPGSVPTVSLSSPLGNTSVLLGAAVPMVAAASDVGGSIARVEFYANGNFVGSTDRLPYSISFRPTAVGEYQLYAVAVDNDGNEAVSSEASLLTVTNNIDSVLAVRTNDLFVRQVLLDGPLSVELNPGDPIAYSVAYGRNIATAGQTHETQTWTVTVSLSTDGDPDNVNNYTLGAFVGTYPRDEAIGRFEVRTIRSLLPANYTGTYYLVAKIVGNGDNFAPNDFPAVTVTSTSRVTIRPVDSQTVSRASVSTGGGDSNEFSEAAQITADGRYVVFQSEATNLVGAPAAPAGISQIYLRDNLTGETRMISQRGGVAGNAESRYPVISTNGKVVDGVRKYFVAYQSSATNLLTVSDTNQATDVFLYDVSTGITERVSLVSGTITNQQANAGSFLPSISGNGDLVVFESDATNLLPSSAAVQDTNARRDVYLFNRLDRSVQAVSTTSAGVFGNAASTQPVINSDLNTADNTYTVAFRSFATNLAGGRISTARSVIYAKTISVSGIAVTAGTVIPVSLVRENLGSGTATYAALNADAFDPAISANGRHIAFATRATNVLAPDGTSNSQGFAQVWVVDRAFGASGPVSSSSFDQAGNVRLSLVSAAINPVGGGITFGNNDSLAPVISGNARFIGYRSEATNLQTDTIVRSDGLVFSATEVEGYADTNGGADIYLRDTGIQSIVVVGGGSGYSNNPAQSPLVTISGGGGVGASAVAIVEDGMVTRVDIVEAGSGYTTAPNITIAAPASGTTATATVAVAAYSERVSVNQFGAQVTGAVGTITVPASRDIAMSADGRYVVFSSTANSGGSFIFNKSNRQPLDNNAKKDIYIVDRREGDYVVPVEGSAPTVTVLMDNRLATFGSARLIAARAFDGADSRNGEIVTGEIRQIEIYAGNALLSRTSYTSGESSATAFSPWTAPLIAGSVQVYAIAEDSNGNRTVSAPLNVSIESPNSLAPTVSLQISAATVTLGQTVTLTATASDPDDGVKAVRFYVNGVALALDPDAPYTATFTPSIAGTYQFQAIVYDNTVGGPLDSAEEFGRIRNTALSGFAQIRVLAPPAPTVQIDSPSASITTSTGEPVFFLVSSESNNSNASIASVELRANNVSIGTAERIGFTSQYRLTWRPTTAGIYSVVAIARDTQDAAATSAARSVTVQNVTGSAPAVVITSPVINPVFNAAQVPTNAVTTLRSLAIDTDGSVTGVDYYLSGRFLGAATLSAGTFNFALDGSLVAAGLYELIAVARDNQGNVKASLPLAIQVTSPLGAVDIVSLPANQIVDIKRAQPLFIRFSATTPDPLTRVTQVTLSVNGERLTTDAVRFGNTDEYTLTWTPDFTGLFTLVASATDSTGATVRSTERLVRVTEPTGSAPIVSVTGPRPATGTGGGTEAPAVNTTNQSVILVTTSAIDPDGSIATVELFLNNKSFGFASQTGASSYSRNVSLAGLTPGTYLLTAVAVDNVGNRTQSASVALNVAASLNPPSGSLNAAPTSIVRGQATVLTVSASDSDGTVASVQFVANGVLVGTDTEVPFALSWIPTVAGSYAVSAVITDNSGNTTVSNAVNVSVTENNAPTGSLSVSTTSVLLGQSVSVNVLAGDTDGAVASVQIYANGTSLAIDTAAPYNATWTPTLAGSYVISAIVTDDLGNFVQTNSITVTVGGTAPSVSVTAPLGGATATVGTPLFLEASATAAGTIQSLEFYVGSTLAGVGVRFNQTNLYRVEWLPTLADVGARNVTAVAIDNIGQATVSAAVAITVRTVVGQAPSTSFLYVPETLTSESQMYVSATASDPDGVIRQVELFGNGRLLGKGTKLPSVPNYQFIISRDSVRGLGLGAVTLTLVATDNSGNSTSASSIVIMTQSQFAPPSSITISTNKTEFYYGDTQEFTAQVIQGGLRVDSVTYFTWGVQDPSFENSPNPATVAPSYRYLAQVIAGGVFESIAIATDFEGNQVVSNSLQYRSAGRLGVMPGLRPFSSPSDFARQAYADLLNRGPGESEVNQFVAVANASGFGAALDTLLSTSEFADVREAAAVSFFILGKWPTYEKLVEYTQRLRGVVDAADEGGERVGGLPPPATATRALRLQALMQYLYDSGEYAAAYGNIPDMTVNAGAQQYNNVKRFVDRLYLNLIGRVASTSEALTALQLLNLVVGETPQNPDAEIVITQTGTYSYNLYANLAPSVNSTIQVNARAAALLASFYRRTPTADEITQIRSLTGAARYDVLKVAEPYISRFMFWSNATNLGGGWRQIAWFGKFYTKNGRWIYHETLGWLYAPESAATESSVFLWDPVMQSWLWTNSTNFPWVYRYKDTAWLYYQIGSTAPRYFYNSKTRTWESR